MGKSGNGWTTTLAINPVIMLPQKSNKSEEPAPVENPAAGRSEGRTQELESRLTKQETEGKTYATREWVFKWTLSILGFLLVALLYFNKELLLLFLKLKKI